MRTCGAMPLHFLFDPRLDVLGGDGQHEGALQALVLGLDGLDGHVAQVLNESACGDPATAAVVRAEGLEPPRLSHWNLNPARLPIPPRARGRLKGARPITGMRRWATRGGARRSGLKRRPSRCSSIPPVPETPPQTPAEPSQPGQPIQPPPETPPQGPDIDVPTPPHRAPTPRRGRSRRSASRAAEPKRRSIRSREARRRNNASGPHRGGSCRACRRSPRRPPGPAPQLVAVEMLVVPLESVRCRGTGRGCSERVLSSTAPPFTR